MTKGETSPRMNPEAKPTKELREVPMKELENVHGGWEGGVGDPRLNAKTAAGIVGPQDNPE
jgi:hypothetical protein